MASPLSSFDRRAARVRRTLRRAQGSRPRLSVFRSSKHIYAQIIDDSKGFTRRCRFKHRQRAEG